jgi:hypothetical protein
MDRTFNFGAFQIRAVLKGLIEDQPASQVFVMTAAGQADAGMVGTGLPLPSEAALYLVKEFRRALSMGPQRLAQYTMMREKRKPAELREIHQKAARAFAIASEIPGGDAALAQAEAQLQQEFEREKSEMETSAQQAAEHVGKERTVGFDLGPVRMVVEWAATIPDPQALGELAVFRVRADVQGVATHHANIATNAPLFSGAAGWLLDEFAKVLQTGPEKYVTEEMEQGTEPEAGESLKYANSLHAAALALGLAGIEQARQLLEQAAAQERGDVEEVELRRLEEEQREVRREIERLRSGKRRSK